MYYVHCTVSHLSDLDTAVLIVVVGLHEALLKFSQHGIRYYLKQMSSCHNQFFVPSGA